MVGLGRPADIDGTVPVVVEREIPRLACWVLNPNDAYTILGTNALDFCVVSLKDAIPDRSVG